MKVFFLLVLLLASVEASVRRWNYENPEDYYGGHPRAIGHFDDFGRPPCHAFGCQRPPFKSGIGAPVFPDYDELNQETPRRLGLKKLGGFPVQSKSRKQAERDGIIVPTSLEDYCMKERQQVEEGYTDHDFYDNGDENYGDDYYSTLLFAVPLHRHLVVGYTNIVQAVES
ncbi:hypothetical protein QR680_013705 [Steinernema hermaphroditum]|uniref:Uncharacterized protein n=1 Tax=Steinernema hermaphroditum TaxID=289476 RepID=A0AA39I6E3_9BILA|nr:hypothetical protein QR680_013705 [Steinernema hermaphroditum]